LQWLSQWADGPGVSGVPANLKCENAQQAPSVSFHLPGKIVQFKQSEKSFSLFITMKPFPFFTKTRKFLRNRFQINMTP
jgi:hypothetical protein